MPHRFAMPKSRESEHEEPKTSPTAKVNKKAETVLWGEDAGASSVQSVISTDATEELCPAENIFKRKQLSHECLLGNLRDSEAGRVSGEEEQGEEEQAAECGSKVCVGF